MKTYLRIIIFIAAAAALVAGIICGKKGVFDDLFETAGSGIKDRVNSWKKEDDLSTSTPATQSSKEQE